MEQRRRGRDGSVVHGDVIEDNLSAWSARPILRAIYGAFYRRIVALLDTAIPGPIVEVGSGIGNLKSHLPDVIATDLFTRPWLDLVCDGYELPFRSESLSHLILFDVFHHLARPNAMLAEARRALRADGRLVIFDPYISLCSLPAYGIFHQEPVAWRATIDLSSEPPRDRSWYAAQGNATRLFFGRERQGWSDGWRVFHRSAFASFTYLLSGGFSGPQLYPAVLRPLLERGDGWLSSWPRLFGARCLVGLSPADGGPPGV
jgi:SAM-dependent methyltransferase